MPANLNQGEIIMLSKVVSTSKRPGMFTFTFDDGVSKNVEELLEILDNQKLKITFFIIGETLKIKGNADLLKSAHEKGHIIGNHTWSHQDITKLNNEDLIREINDTTNKIAEITGERPKYFRPPYGALTEAIGYKIINMGYKILLWNVDTQDWNRTHSQTDLLNSYKDTFSKANPFKHSYMNLQHVTRKESIELIPDIIKIVTDKGFKIVELADFLSP